MIPRRGACGTDSATARHRVPERVVALLAAVMIGGALLVFWSCEGSARGPWMSSDSASFLNIARRMAEGDVLYVDWKATNPPAYHLFALGSVQLAGILGLPLVFTHYALILSLGAVGLVALLRSLRAARADPCTVVATCAAYLVFLVRPGLRALDFGQREQLFMLLLLPLLFQRALPGSEPRRLNPVLMLLLGFAATFKPYFLVWIVAVELIGGHRAWRARRTELLALAGGMLAVPLLLGLHSPRALSAFVSDLLPFHLGGGYGWYREAALPSLAHPGPIALILGTGVLVVLAWSARHRVGHRASMLWVTMLALAWASLLHQGRFFSYHFDPVWGLCWVGGAWFSGTLSRRHRLARYVPVVVMIAASAGAIVLLTHEVRDRRDPLYHRLTRVVPVGSRVLVVAQDIHGLCTPMHEVLRCLGPWPLHYRLPAIVHDSDAQRRQRALAAYAAALRAQIQRQHPGLLAFSTSRARLLDRSPADLFTLDDPVFDRRLYRSFTAAELRLVHAPGWLLLVRREPTTGAALGRAHTDAFGPKRTLRARPTS